MINEAGIRRCASFSAVSESRHDRIGKHDERDVPVPAMPGAAFVMVETEFVLGGLESFLDTPARALDADQRLDRCSLWAPGGEVGVLAIGQAATDQHAAGP